MTMSTDHICSFSHPSGVSCATISSSSVKTFHRKSHTWMACRFWKSSRSLLIEISLISHATHSDCLAPWLAGGAWCCTWWCICKGGGDGACCLICWIWTCWIFCGDVCLTFRVVVFIFVLCVLATGDVDGFSVTITTPVPLQVVHLVTVVTFFFFAGVLCCTMFCTWITFWFISFTSNLMSPSGDTKICVGRTFCAFASFWMHVSQRISFGPLRFAFCWICPPQVMHLFLSPFWCDCCCCCCCCCWTIICSFNVWWSWAGSSESAATIWIWPKFWPLSVIRFWAWINWPGFCVTTVTVSLCESSWLWVRLCWFSRVRWENIWLQTSHLKLMLEIVF